MTYSNANLISGFDLDGDNEVVFHSIVVDHPFMNDIGLGVFTTGQLYKWATTFNENGDFVNLRFFNNFKLNVSECLVKQQNQNGKDTLVFSKQEFLNKTKPIFSMILGNGLYKCSSANEEPPGKFSAWRLQEGLLAGEYVAFTSTFTESSTWQYRASNYQTTLGFNDLRLGDFAYPENLDDVISPVIAMNELYAANQLNNSYEARFEFLKDIKSSKERYVEWKSNVPFFLHLGVDVKNGIDAGCINCELVTYRLYLYDTNITRDTSRTITISEPIIVASKKDYSGRTYVHKEDGRSTPISIAGSPTQNVAAPMSMTWNEFENGWESGTQQILAMITTNINPATYPSLENVKTKSTEELLRPTNTFIFPTGKAIPISMQNGNPLQWGPDYANFENCRDEENNDKLELVVHNSSLRTWASGDFAMLQKINGVWIPSEIARPSDLEPVYESSISKWDFTYLMTNAHHFFRTRLKDSEGLPFGYGQYEDAFYKKYYGIPLTGPDYTKVANSHFQVTSFDFMGPSIGGLRPDKHALACTQFSIDAAGNALENNGQYINGDASAPFFGCVFPDGYDTQGKYDEYKSDSHALIKARQTDKYFTEEIRPDVNIFANKNANIGSANASGMFFTDDSSVRHLPADIALNASPASLNGCPIKDISKIPLDFVSTNAQDIFRSYFLNYGSGNWLYRDFDDQESAFDFKPIRPNKIQFRPLKLEVYANFEHKNIYSANDDYNSGNYGEFGAQCWKIVNDEQSPISLLAYERNLGNLTMEPLDTIFANLRNPSSIYAGLGYNISAFNTDQYSNLNPLPSDIAKFSRYWWGTYRNWTLPGPRPAGAVGIIGASCTVTANVEINFLTENYIGVGSMFNIAEGLFNPILDFLRVPRTPWEPAWGGYGGDNYNALQTTQLFARVFQSWPKDLTIYDPRFFAVHHFNQGVKLCSIRDPNLDKPGICPKKELYYNGEKYNDQNYTPTAISYPNGFYYVDVSETSVDMKMPTFYNSNGSSFVASNGVDVYSNGPHSVRNILGLWRNLDHWAVDPQRRGKLLPYNYQIKTISLPTTNLKIWIKDSMSQNETILDYSIIVFDQGTGYTKDDTFTVAGGRGIATNYILKVSEIDITDGSIKAFTLEEDSNSYGYLPEDFLSSAEIVPYANNITIASTSVRIVPKKITGNGKGFVAGFIRGVVTDFSVIDEKPKEACDVRLIKLTPDSPAYPVGGSTQFIPPVSDNFETSAKIVNKSPNGRYDVFLHFHNDISHTAMKDWSNGAGGPLAVENQVTLTISPV